MQALALAGIGAGISLAFVALSVYVPVMMLTFSVLAGTGVMLPLSRGYLREGILCYIASAALSLLFGPLRVIQFILGFGLWPLAVYLANVRFEPKRSVKIYYAVVYAAKLLYFNLIFWLVTVLLEIELRNPVFLFWVIANLAFLAYDLMILNLFKLVKRYAKRK